MYYIQYIVARFFIFLLLLFPERLRFKFGDFLGTVAYKLIKSRRLTALINLRMAFPENPSLSVQKLKYKCKVPLIQNFTLLFYLFFLLCTNLYHNNLILLILLFLFSILFLVIYLTLSFLHFLVIYNIHLLSWLLLRYS